MTVKKRGLGRGLDALLGGVETVAAAPKTSAAEGELRRLPVDLVRRGKYQPRVDMHPESLQDLADSIKAQGVVQPIVVKPTGNGGYEIIAGERRWRAAQLAGLQEIPAVVRDVSDQAAMAMALIENIQRENLNPMEEANALQRLIQEFQLTHQEVAEAVGRCRAAVSNLLRLLELNSDVRELVEQRQLEMGHARALLALKDAAQSAAARSVVDKGLSVRETERLVKRWATTQPGGKSSAAVLDPDIRRLQDDLSELLGAAVRFQHAATGKGKLVISYNSLDELEGILAHVK
ncbi:MAG: ParB/RepB/Spo0J family partition protein [Gammaproteobacteria bacterium]